MSHPDTEIGHTWLYTWYKTIEGGGGMSRWGWRGGGQGAVDGVYFTSSMIFIPEF